jgi:hypothetical protein
MIRTCIKRLLLVRNIVGLFVLTMFFSCDDEPLKNHLQQDKIPNGETYNFRLLYTDSAKVKTILESSLNKDFSNQRFPYTEFPEGMVLRLYDDMGHENIIRSKYAIYYLPTQMVELRDSVSLSTYEGKQLKTSQLFWQASTDWVFTERPFEFVDSLQGTITKGIGMDFDKQFTHLKAHKITGIIPIRE